MRLHHLGNMLDALSGGALLSKSYQESYDLIERIIANTN